MKILDSLDPWSASGPGWSNAGVTLFWRDSITGEVERETLYAHDLAKLTEKEPALYEVWSILLPIHARFREQIVSVLDVRGSSDGGE